MLLELRDVSVSRGTATILRVASLAIDDGETVAVLGPNGAGKSTLLRVAGMLVTPTTGQVRLDGDPVDEAALRLTLAAVLQRPLLRRGKVIDNAALGLRFRGVGRAEARRNGLAWLDRLGILHLAERRASTLSGGEAQRVSLARALAVQPRLLLLDEPFSPVDERTRGQLVLDLREILSAEGIAMLLVTHDRREAAALAARTVVLDAGQLRAEGPTARVLYDPQLRHLLGGADLLDDALAALAFP